MKDFENAAFFEACMPMDDLARRGKKTLCFGSMRPVGLIDPRTGKHYLYLETLGGGMSARPTGDGKDGVQVHISNTSNLPVEAIETEYPLLVEEYSLVQDSGGAGRHRGGMGLRRVVRPVAHDCIFNGVGERFRRQPWNGRAAHMLDAKYRHQPQQ